jgi:hypothetical protein
MSSEKIKIIYQQSKTTDKVDFIGPIVFILLILSVFGYLYTNVQRKLLHMSWSEQKCNPRYLFFSGFLDPFNKNPWVKTQDNFQKCVSSNIYKDPSLTRVIKENESKILKHENEMKQNLEIGKKYVGTVNEKWDETKDKKQQDIFDVKTTNMNNFEEQETLYQEVLIKTSQMFHLLGSVVRYIQGVLIYNVSNYKNGINEKDGLNNKEGLTIEKRHDYFMSKYDNIYKDYSDAYHKLNIQDYHGGINSARNAIEGYNALNDELNEFMNAHYSDVISITESCYQLKYNMDDQTCTRLFPNLNQQFIDYYPTLKKIINT